jgi:hypothetical protein
MRSGHLAAAKKYRSGLEGRLHAGPLRKCDYESCALEYTEVKNYIPDFIYKQYIFEAKGRFRTYAEASKYIAVRKANPDYELIFVFSDPNKPMPGATKRRDGTKLSHGEWATKNGFRYFTESTIPRSLLK